MTATFNRFWPWLAGAALVLALGAALWLPGWLNPAPVFMEGCTVDSRGVLPAEPPTLPALTAADWVRGPLTAPVTVTVYTDFQCPACAQLHATLTELAQTYPGDFAVVYRAFPLEPLHDKARLAVQAAAAAGAQGQFWAMHDLLFTRQADWVTLPPADFTAWLAEQATALGLNATQFTTDLTSPANVQASAAAYTSTLALGLDGAPALAFNGHYYEGPVDAWSLGSYIQLIKLEDRHFATCPTVETRPTEKYRATLYTTQGPLVMELFPAQAPLAVNNFVFLARRGWYDGVPFYRVYPGFAAQTGDPSGTGLGGPGYTFRDEPESVLRYDLPGMVGMANSGPNTNGSQFFITFAPQPTLDGQYTAFGRVIEGLDTVGLALTPRDPATNPLDLPEPDRIISVTVTLVNP